MRNSRQNNLKNNNLMRVYIKNNNKNNKMMKKLFMMNLNKIIYF